MPSAAFGLASYIVTALGTHPKISKSYISYSRSMPDLKSSISEGRVPEKAQGPSVVQPNLDKAFAIRLRTGQPQSAAGAQHSQPAPSR
jgi:hypothetical protein